MGGTTLALPRWEAEPYFYRDRIFRGRCLDIGPGHDPLARYAGRFPHLGPYDCVDHNIQNAQYGATWYEGSASDLKTLPEGRYGCVYSSHCLEHVVEPSAALRAWWARVAPGGYLCVIVPSWLHYERLLWPPTKNTDHKTAWILAKRLGPSGIPHIRGLVNEAQQLISGVILRALTLDAGFDPRTAEDQTADGTCESGLEIVVFKPDL